MGQAQHGRRCACAECAMFRDGEVTAAALRASYERLLDVTVKLVEETPERDRDKPACRAARAFLVEAGRRVR